MARNVFWGAAVVATLAIGLMAFGFNGAAVESAEKELPTFVVGDTYAFVGLQGGVLSGTLMSSGPYPWVEVKIDNVDANVYQINLSRVERYKHIGK